MFMFVYVGGEWGSEKLSFKIGGLQQPHTLWLGKCTCLSMKGGGGQSSWKNSYVFFLYIYSNIVMTYVILYAVHANNNMHVWELLASLT